MRFFIYVREFTQQIARDEKLNAYYEVVFENMLEAISEMSEGRTFYIFSSDIDDPTLLKKGDVFSSKHFYRLSKDELKKLKDILYSFDEDADMYTESERIKNALESIGWTCDYGLDGTLFDVLPKQFFNDLEQILEEK